MAGIIFAALIGDHFSMILIFALIIFSITAFLIACIRPAFNTGLICFIIASVLMFLTGIAGMVIRFRIEEHLIKDEIFKGLAIVEIMEPVSVKNNVVRTTGLIRYRYQDGKLIKNRQNILISFAKDTNSAGLLPGERVLCKVNLTRIEGPSNPGEFDYAKYMSARGIFNRTFVSSENWKMINIKEPVSPVALACRMQKRLLDQYTKIGLNPTLYSLLSAITLGYKSDLEAQTRKVFAGAGVMHIMALSGFNVAVIAFAIGYLLFFTNRIESGKLFKTIIIIFTIWLFAFVTGLSPSVTRAAVMITFVLTGTLMRRRIGTGNILFISAFFLLAFSPLLISDVSFQLSFAAVLGIILIEPPLRSFIRFRLKIADKIWQLFTVSCAAQLATLPLTIYYFHQFPVYFWIANLFVIPLVSIIICVAGFFLVFSFFEPFMHMLGEILELLLKLLHNSVSAISVLPGSLIENISLSTGGAMFLALLIIGMAMFFQTHKKQLILASFCFCLVFLSISLIHQFRISRQQVLMVGNLKGVSVVHVITGKKGVILCDNLQKTDQSRINYHFGNFLLKKGISLRTVKLIDPGLAFGFESSWLGKSKLFRIAAGKVLILYDDELFKCKTTHKMNLEFLILTNNVPLNMKGILELVSPQKIIIDSSVLPSRSGYWKRFCTENKIPCHIVSRDGYFLHAGK